MDRTVPPPCGRAFGLGAFGEKICHLFWCKFVSARPNLLQRIGPTGAITVAIIIDMQRQHGLQPGFAPNAGVDKDIRARGRPCVAFDPHFWRGIITGIGAFDPFDIGTRHADRSAFTGIVARG